MSNIVKLHQPCPHCGSSDALSVYADGGAKCFSCGWSWKEFEKKESVKKVEEGLRLDVGSFTEISDRHLTKETCTKYGVKTR